MTTLISRATAVAALLMMVSLSADAQDPVRLPGVSVTAQVEKPGPRVLVGIVVDTSGNVVAGVEVTIPALARRVVTRADGTFRFDSVSKGTYSMRARKLGFAPQVREVEMDSAGGVAQFQLLPIITALPAMVSSADEHGLSGHVENTRFQPVGGANVRLLGTGFRATTDENGDFFIPAKAGRYMVAIERENYAKKLAGVTVPEDSGRHMNAWLTPSTVKVSKEKYWVIEDIRERQAWTQPNDKVLYTREDLEKMKIEWIYDAVAMNWSKFPKQGLYDRDCAVVVNGGPEFVKLNELTIDDIETVEIYSSFGSGGTTTSATAPRSKNAKVKATKFNTPGSNLTVDAAWWNRTRQCPGVYVWGR